MVTQIRQDLYEMRLDQSWGHLPTRSPNIVQFFRQEFGDLPDSSNILETGTNLGFSASMIAELYPQCTVHTFDIRDWYLRDAMYENKKMYTTDLTAQQLLKMEHDNVRCYTMSSAQMSFIFPVGFFSAAFIDGDHTFEGACADIRNALLLDIPRVIIDNLEDPEVSYAVQEFSCCLNRRACLEYTSTHPQSGEVRLSTIASYDVIS